MPHTSNSSMDIDDEAEEALKQVIGEPNNVLLLKKEVSMGSERQISMDPISVKQPSSEQQQHRIMVNNMYPTSPTIDLLIPFAPSSKSKLFSLSLPNSASSSPRYPPPPPHMSKKKMKHQSQPSSLSTMYRQDSIALANIESLHEINLLKSKSCGEGRASGPPEDFDLSLSNVSSVKYPESHNRSFTNYYKNESNSNMEKGEEEHNVDTFDEKFKCRALCLYLPGFHKGKPVKARRQGSDISQSKESELGHVVSKRVSLEKFDCVSWTSSGRMMDDNEYEGDASNLFFDLPLELIKCSINDTDSPVTTAFVFDKEPKPVLKNNGISRTASTKSSESVRRVRFSTSSHTDSPSSCITPGVDKSRDDFNAYFEAQSALNVL